MAVDWNVAQPAFLGGMDNPGFGIFPDSRERVGRFPEAVAFVLPRLPNYPETWNLLSNVAAMANLLRELRGCMTLFSGWFRNLTAGSPGLISSLNFVSSERLYCPLFIGGHIGLT